MCTHRNNWDVYRLSSVALKQIIYCPNARYQQVMHFVECMFLMQVQYLLVLSMEKQNPIDSNCIALQAWMLHSKIQISLQNTKKRHSSCLKTFSKSLKWILILNVFQIARFCSIPFKVTQFITICTTLINSVDCPLHFKQLNIYQALACLHNGSKRNNRSSCYTVVFNLSTTNVNPPPTVDLDLSAKTIFFFNLTCV